MSKQVDLLSHFIALVGYWGMIYSTILHLYTTLTVIKLSSWHKTTDDQTIKNALSSALEHEPNKKLLKWFKNYQEITILNWFMFLPLEQWINVFLSWTKNISYEQYKSSKLHKYWRFFGFAKKNQRLKLLLSDHLYNKIWDVYCFIYLPFYRVGLYILSWNIIERERE